MVVNIKTYQNAYEIALNKFKKNKYVIAVVVYGSMISGDIWEKSDIDFMVITREPGKTDKIYSKVLDVPVHINYISKSIFVDSYNNTLKGGTFHKAFFMGKLVYCIDEEIKEIHNSTRFYSDRDISIRNIEIFCNLINSVHYAKKFMDTGKYETSFQWCVEVLKNYARVMMNSKGHITDKDILSFAVNMNSKVENIFVTLNDDKPLLGRLNYIIEATEKFIMSNIESISKPLIAFMEQSESPCSASDIQNSSEFKQVDVDINVLLELLSSVGYIKEKNRRYLAKGEEYLIDEIVYYKD